MDAGWARQYHLMHSMPTSLIKKAMVKCICQKNLILYHSRTENMCTNSRIQNLAVNVDLDPDPTIVNFNR
jgi:hypothetical protein